MKPGDEEPFDAEAAGGGGRLPGWMLVIYVTLLVWGGWYLVHFWRGPGGLAP